jgi:hypothetical protein
LPTNVILKVDRMVEKPALNPEPARRKRGRPTLKAEVQRALAELGVDPRSVDPLAVLAGIMMDATVPASARVQAARALIAARATDGPDGSAVAADAVSVRAQQLLAARRKAN